MKLSSRLGVILLIILLLPIIVIIEIIQIFIEFLAKEKSNNEMADY